LRPSNPLSSESLDDAETAETMAAFGFRAALAAGVLAGLAAPFGLLLLLVRARWGPLWHLDHGAVSALHDYAVAHPLFVSVMKAASRAGSSSVYWVFAIGLTTWLIFRQRRRGLLAALFAVVAIGGGGLLNLAVKALVDRVRPILPNPVAHAGGLSFPSGHAQAAIIGYGVLILLVGPTLSRRSRQVLVAVCVVAVLIIGFSRVALGVHYPSDVVGGYLLGAAWLLALLLVFGRTLGPARQPRSREQVTA
jgi:undecaprenyl-diphosphatase